jgi:predicted RNase H-like HicB family nuclease
MPVDVYLEVAPRRTFASARDWPGWCRAGKTEEAALQALADASARYAEVAGRAGLAFEPVGPDSLVIVERLPGSATTEFGAPGAIAAGDAPPLAGAEADRTEALLRACWEVFDAVVEKAPAVLLKGPRGGGRDRDKIAEHVVDAESAYAPKIGLRRKPPRAGDPKGIAEWRAAILNSLRSEAQDDAGAVGRWPARFAARRIAWHAVDHAWEIEDRIP